MTVAVLEAATERCPEVAVNLDGRIIGLGQSAASDVMKEDVIVELSRNDARRLLKR